MLNMSWACRFFNLFLDVPWLAMKTLFLLRHAKASKDDPALPDLKRPLSERGFSDARVVSEALRQQDLIPEKIISSNAVRAYTTAFVFAATFEKVSGDIELTETLYDCTEKEYLEAIAGISNEFSSCMIAGHNDTISQVADTLTGKNLEAMNTCSVIVIRSEADTWAEFDSSPCKLLMRLDPSDLR